MRRLTAPHTDRFRALARLLPGRPRCSGRSPGLWSVLWTVRLPLVGLLLAAGLIAWPAGRAAHVSAAQATRAAFLEPFDGRPSAPTPWHGQGWDISVHSRDRETWNELEPMAAHHGADCSAPPNAHMINQYEDAVYHCNNHIMTAINASGYGAIYLTPNQLVDFSSGEAVVSFDLSTLRTSGRDWVDLWITPYDDHLQLPLDRWLPDLSGEPGRSVHIKMGESGGGTSFGANIFRGAQVQELKGKWWVGYESVLTPSAVRRDPFELRISRTSLKFGMPTYDLWWLDETIPDLGWDKAIIQLGHHSYNPKKDCDGPCAPNTWHWDSLAIQLAQPFTIISGRQRWATAERGADVTFDQPAPEGSHLRFAAIGSGIRFSLDGGANWQNAEPRTVRGQSDAGAIFLPYWTPVPAGVTNVRFDGGPWRGGNWAVRDISIWSMQQSAEVTPESPGEDGPTDEANANLKPTAASRPGVLSPRRR